MLPSLGRRRGLGRAALHETQQRLAPRMIPVANILHVQAGSADCPLEEAAMVAVWVGVDVAIDGRLGRADVDRTRLGPIARFEERREEYSAGPQHARHLPD